MKSMTRPTRCVLFVSNLYIFFFVLGWVWLDWHDYRDFGIKSGMSRCTTLRPKSASARLNRFTMR